MKRGERRRVTDGAYRVSHVMGTSQSTSFCETRDGRKRSQDDFYGGTVRSNWRREDMLWRSVHLV